jgi:hypothetical protein
MKRHWIAALILASMPAVARAQAEAPSVAAAVAARDSGDLKGAEAILREVLAREPENGDGIRALAQILYWTHDNAGATALYERGIALHPEDRSLKLDYGRMLVETLFNSRAREILTPLLDDADSRSRAATLLGTLSYWEGDLTSAARMFRAASADSSAADARRMLGEIRAASSPWASLEASGAHDDQPLNVLRAILTAGMFLDPLTTLSISARPDRLESDDSVSAVVTRAEVALSHHAAGSRMDVRLAAGVVNHASDPGVSTTDWTARGGLRVRVSDDVALEGRADRSPYLYTVASVAQPTMSQSFATVVAFANARGWMAEAAGTLSRFEDDNSVRGAYAWALAPVARSETAILRAGYSLSYQDAAESRYKIADRSYAPYYTPQNIVTHSLLASTQLRPSPGTSFTLRGGYGFASEDAPVPLTTGLAKRRFHPWDAHAAIDASLSELAKLTVFADATKTAFYTWVSAGALVSVKLRKPVQ